MICGICGKICITLDKNNICMQCHLDAKDAEISKLKARIEELEEELADYKEGTEGMRLAIRDLRDERDKYKQALEDKEE